MSITSLINSGDKFNSWTFVKHCEERKGYGVFQCECGKEKEVHIGNVIKGKSKSCGCVFRKETSERCRKDFPIGTLFGYLTVIGESVKKGKDRYTPCVCCCGEEVLAKNNKLQAGRKDNCGCKTIDKFREKKNVKIEVGAKYNRLTILQEVDPVVDEKGYRKRQLECLCDCGNVKVIEMREVTGGGTQSCGCLKVENAYKTHGMSKTSTYHIWCGIKERCFNANNPAYKYYGGRGITMCNRWNKSFENFLEDMGERPSEEYSIDRIDLNGNYEPQNCKWATRIEQARNKSNNHIVEYGGQTKTFAEWVDVFGENYSTLWGKCDREKWDTTKVFNELMDF